MTKRIVILVVFAALLCTTQAFAGWVWMADDLSIPNPMQDDNGNPIAEVKQDEYYWDADAVQTPGGPLVIPDPEGVVWPDGVYLYTYTITNVSGYTLTSFGFL